MKEVDKTLKWIRVEPKTLEKIKELAVAERRSVAAQIGQLIQEALEARKSA